MCYDLHTVAVRLLFIIARYLLSYYYYYCPSCYNVLSGPFLSAHWSACASNGEEEEEVVVVNFSEGKVHVICFNLLSALFTFCAWLVTLLCAIVD